MSNVSLKEHVEKLFDEFKDRCDSERLATKEVFEIFKRDLDEKTKLAATEIERRFNAYPTIKDFNDLKETVTTEFASALGKAKAYAIGLGLFGIMSALIVGVFTYIKTS